MAYFMRKIPPELHIGIFKFSDFDADRVKAMREAIANGSFRVNAEAVADKLLANTEEFLVHARG